MNAWTRFWLKYFAGVRWIELVLFIIVAMGAIWCASAGVPLRMREINAGFVGVVVLFTYLREPKTAEHLVISTISAINPLLGNVLGAAFGKTDSDPNVAAGVAADVAGGAGQTAGEAASTVAPPKPIADNGGV